VAAVAERKSKAAATSSQGSGKPKDGAKGAVRRKGRRSVQETRAGRWIEHKQHVPISIAVFPFFFLGSLQVKVDGIRRKFRVPFTAGRSRTSQNPISKIFAISTCDLTQDPPKDPDIYHHLSQDPPNHPFEVSQTLMNFELALG
jgi:hypothetical protein